MERWGFRRRSYLTMLEAVAVEKPGGARRDCRLGGSIDARRTKRAAEERSREGEEAGSQGEGLEDAQGKEREKNDEDEGFVVGRSSRRRCEGYKLHQ